MNAMNHFSSDEFVNFPAPCRRFAPSQAVGIAAFKTGAKRMCNSHAKCQVLFVACNNTKARSELAKWIEKPNVGVKLPTPDLGLSQVGPW
jgi:hypothetical protein